MTNSRSDRPGEFELIAELFAPLATHAGAFGLTDDVAILTPPPGMDLVLKTDAIVEGVHFLPDDPADLVAQKALRVNLSDLGAKGALPVGYLLSLSIPERISMEWLRAFADGLARDQGPWEISLLGGDTTSTPGPVTISVTMVGYVPAGQVIRRSGARPGDVAFVTGLIGNAGAGLEVRRGGGRHLATGDRGYLTRCYQSPLPPVGFGKALRGIASAALDISDGLLADFGHMAQASGVKICIDAGRIPLSPAARNLWGAEAALRAATAGDDYEIAFAAPPARRDEVLRAALACGVRVTEIGRVEAGRGVVLLDDTGAEIAVARAGYTHF